MSVRRSAPQLHGLDPYLLVDASATCDCAIFVFASRGMTGLATIHLRSPCHPHPEVGRSEASAIPPVPADSTPTRCQVRMPQ